MGDPPSIKSADTVPASDEDPPAFGATDTAEAESIDEVRKESKERRGKRINDGTAGRAARDKLRKRLEDMLFELAQVHAHRRTASEVDAREYERAFEDLVDLQARLTWTNAAIEAAQGVAIFAVGLAADQAYSGSRFALLTVLVAILLVALAMASRYNWRR